MNCPFCGHGESKVIDSRESADGVRRRRECMRCELRFTTYERVHTMPLMVAKRDGRREPFAREKLERSLRLACAKRPLEAGAVSKLAEDIENELQRVGRPEAESQAIGEMAMERLRSLDRVAYIRFASVYRDFKDVDSFAKEIEALENGERAPVASVNQLALIPAGDTPAEGREKRGRKAGAAAAR